MGTRWGSPDGVLLIESYFFKDETHITDQIDRDAGKTRQYWTMSTVPGSSLAGKDLYVLTSQRYTLRRGRLRV